MYGRLKGKAIKRRASIGEYAILVLIAVTAFVLAGAAHNRGIEKKWLTAFFGTLLPFCLVIFLRRRNLRWSFWLSLAICLAMHLVVVWIFFQYVLANFHSFPILLWYPFMLGEIVVLLIAVKRIEEKITGRRETIKLSF